METEKFKDLFDFQSKSKILAGEGLKQGEFPFYTSSSILKKWIDKAQFFNKALIFGTGGSASIHYAEGRFSVSTDCLVAVAKKDKSFNTKYVYYYIFGNIRILEQGFKGAGLKHIAKPYIQNLDIALPNLETQDKIVAILDKAKNLIEKREQTIKMFDELLRATFLDMFGDPILNPKKWDLDVFKNVAKNENSKRVPIKQADRDKREGIYPYYGATGIIDDIDDYKFDGDYLLIAEDGMNLLYNKKNNAFLASGKFWVNNHAHILSYNGKCTLKYLLYFLNLIDLKPYITGIDQVKLNKNNLEKIIVPIPNLELQKKFETIFNKFEENKSKVVQSKTQLENLLNGLSQQAFSGKILYDINVELDALVNSINLDLADEHNNINTIKNDVIFIQRLIDKLNEQDFEDKSYYDKAKYIIFRIMKEEDDLIKQIFKNKKVQLTLQNETA
jgi:type I restriction enzyme, S subunit